jgi:hypothetical protein
MKIIKIISSLVLTVLLVACQTKDLNQIDNLSKKEQVSFTQKLIRFIGKKPEEATHENKFHAYFDSYYRQLASQHQLEFYYLSDDDKIFFVFTRNAPSLTLKKVGIGGYVKFDKKGEITEIEEVFRTWKKVPDELKKLNEELFQKMIQGEDLSPYYTENSNGQEFIEFPNKDVTYDKSQRRWVTTLFDPMEELLQPKQQEMKDKLKKLEEENSTK